MCAIVAIVSSTKKIKFAGERVIGLMREGWAGRFKKSRTTSGLHPIEPWSEQEPNSRQVMSHASHVLGPSYLVYQPLLPPARKKDKQKGIRGTGTIDSRAVEGPNRESTDRESDDADSERGDTGQHRPFDFTV